MMVAGVYSFPGNFKTVIPRGFFSEYLYYVICDNIIILKIYLIINGDGLVSTYSQI